MKRLVQLPHHIASGLSYRLGGFLFTPKPRMIQFPVCDRCNARCIMCNRWEKDADSEISTEKIREVFANDLFSRVEDVNLHGGEPTLRRDLPEICRIVQETCPRLRRLWVSTNGFGTKRIEERTREILETLDFSKLPYLEMNVSIDGLEGVHDRIRGVKGGFQQSVETVHMLNRLAEDHPLKISIGTVIQPLNLHQIDGLEGLAKELGVPINFQPLMFDKFFNISSHENLKFSEADIEKFKSLIRSKLTRGYSTTSFYWCDFLAMMAGARRKSPCAFDRYVFSLYPTGEVLPCSREDWIMFGNVYDLPPDKIWFGPEAREIRKRMRKEVCPTCSLYCGAEFSSEKEFFSYLGYYVRKKFANLLKR